MNAYILLFSASLNRAVVSLAVPYVLARPLIKVPGRIGLDEQAGSWSAS